MLANNLPDNALRLWLQDETNNDYLDTESLQEMYRHFAVDQADPTDLVKDDDRHHCFLIFNADEENKPVGTIVHHLAKCPSRMGITTPFDNQWYLTAGQPVGGQQTTYEFPTDLFEVQDDVVVYTPNRIQREIGNNPDASTIVTVANDENLPDMEVLSTRRGMWIPNQYASLCLEDSLNPVEAWTRLYGAVLQDGASQSCKPLIDFLRIQLLGNLEINESFYDQNELLQPRPGRSLTMHRQSVLSHLTSEAPIPNPSASSTTGITNGISLEDIKALISTLQGGHVAPAPIAAPTSTTTSIEKRWSVNLDSLLLFTLSNTVADLEPVYGAIADAGRKLEKATLQAGYNNIARAVGAATSAPLTVTKDLTTTITEVIFWSGDLDRIDEGLHEFRTVYQSAAKTSQDKSAMQTYDLLAADGNLSLEDVKLFQHVLKAHWPTSFLQLDTTIKVYLNVLSLLLRPTHPIRAAYQLFVSTWNSLTLQLAERFNSNPAMSAQFLRSLQLRTSVYWQSISSLTLNTAMLYPAPNYVELLNSLLIQTWVAPTIPGYVPSITPAVEPAAPAPTGPAIRGNVPSPSGGVVPPPPEEPAARRVENPQRDPELVAAMEGRNFTIRSLFSATVRPPRTSSGKEMCCSYHLNGSCFTNCSRRGNHRPLVGADQITMRSFAKDNIVLPDIGRASA